MKEQLLQKAIQYGEIIRIRYNGGHQPGAVREILPKSILSNHLMAICVVSDSFKCFIVEKIEIVPADTALNYNPEGEPSLPSKDDVEGAALHFRALGFWVQTTSDSLSVHRIGRHKKPLKSPFVWIEHLPSQKSPWKAHGQKHSKSFLTFFDSVQFLYEEEQMKEIRIPAA
jgi:hypothetical protein